MNALLVIVGAVCNAGGFVIALKMLTGLKAPTLVDVITAGFLIAVGLFTQLVGATLMIVTEIEQQGNQNKQ